tara:strand:- start:345 stop:593 length:249 start_codon:yes stop_codon:yes gene_type:complete
MVVLEKVDTAQQPVLVLVVVEWPIVEQVPVAAEVVMQILVVLVVLVSSSLHTPLDKYRKDCYNPKYLNKQLVNYKRWLILHN